MSERETGPLDASLLPPGVTSSFVDGVNGLRMHVLEAGRGAPKLALLLHGFPEIAYSWRGVMPRLAAAGYHVLAPDLRGYGRTTGWDTAFATDLRPFGMLNLLRDVLALVAAIGWRQVALLVGHDVGSVIAGTCALARPDVFRAVVMMSAPFAGLPALPFNTRDGAAPAPAPPDMDAALAALQPPRKHYHTYFATEAANADMLEPPQGLHDFLRAYFHHKSGDWTDNAPFPLHDWSAESLALLPTYYVMMRDETMPQTAAHAMPSAAQIAACAWLPEAELRFYAAEYGRSGFQGGLNWYRGRVTGLHAHELSIYAGRVIDVPAGFIAGARDWGVQQAPGAFERMRSGACTDLRLCELIDGAGHWVQQERTDEVASLLLQFAGGL